MNQKVDRARLRFLKLRPGFSQVKTPQNQRLTEYSLFLIFFYFIIIIDFALFFF